MKKIAIYYFSLAAIVGGSLASCQDYEPFEEEVVREVAMAREYTKNFENRYGKIDPNHNWGFGPITGDLFSTGTRGTEVNRNEWAVIQDKYHCQFPGWPFETQENDNTFSGKYEVVSNSGSGYPNTESDYLYNQSQLTDQVFPAGDVTDEEIQYVSWWFRTHPNPGKLPLHLTDFFIQEISSDNDRQSNGSLVNKSTIYEIKTENGQYVYDSDGKPVYEAKSQSDVPQYGMNYLHAKVFEGTAHPMYGGPEGYDHINNFNRGHSNNLYGVSSVPMDVSADTTAIWTSLGKTNQRLCQFYTSSGTSDFMCYQTEAEKWNDDWNLVHLQFYGPSGRFYDGYYLGFDYDFYAPETYDDWQTKNLVTKYKQYPKDGYYSNWIVKISPAQPLSDTGFTRRIMCEDLGNTFDFDFNDVVFDVTFNITEAERQNYKGGNVDVTVNLRASGGTLPISVGRLTDFDEYEAHKLMGGKDHTTPINVGVGITGIAANYHLTIASIDPDDISVYVKNNGGTLAIGKEGQMTYIKDGESTFNKGNKGDSKLPQKFAVPNTVRWMKEMEQIEDGYEHFAKWVQDANFKYQGKEWYDKALYKDETKIYESGDPGYTTPTSNQ